MLTQDHRSENLSRQLKSKNINYNVKNLKIKV